MEVPSASSDRSHTNGLSVALLLTAASCGSVYQHLVEAIAYRILCTRSSPAAA